MSISGEATLDSVRALEDDFAEAMSHMYSVGNDLARLRARLALETSPSEWAAVAAPTAPPAPHPMAAPAGPAATESAETDTQPVPVLAPAQPGHVTPPPPAAAPFVRQPGMAPPVPPPPPVPATPAQPWWQRDGVVAKILAVVGTGITLIGVAFLLALAIQMGFFGPLARVLSGAALAVGLVLVALVVRRRQDSSIGALGLAATGVATAFLDVLAVTRIYEWVPTALGLALAGLVGLGGLLLARAWDSQLLGVIAVVGVALLAPTVGYDHLLLTGAFLLVLTIAAWPAQISRDWFFLELARVLPTALFLSVLAITDEPDGAIALLAIAFTAFVLVTSLAGARVAALPGQLGVLVPAAALPLLLAGLAVDNQWVGTCLLVALTCMLVLVAGLAQESEQTPTHHRLSGICLGTAGLSSLLAVLPATDVDAWTVPVLLGVSLVWACAALALRHRSVLYVALTTSFVSLLWATPLIGYLLSRGLSPEVGMEHLVSAVVIVALLLVLARAVTTLLPILDPLTSRVLLAGAVLWAGGAVILLGVLVGDLLEDPSGGFTAGQTGATLLWLGTAAVLLLRGLRGSSLAVPAGLAIAAFSVGKLLLFDLAFLGGIARVLSFIIGGLLLLAMGAGYAQALERSRRQGTGPVENSPVGGPIPPTV